MPRAVKTRPRRYFEAVREAARDLERIHSQLAQGVPRQMEEVLRGRERADKETIGRALTILYGRDGEGGLCAVRTPLYATVLSERYVNCQTWKQIAQGLGCSTNWARVVGNNALQAIDCLGLLDGRDG